jgi:hypothetical protein
MYLDKNAGTAAKHKLHVEGCRYLPAYGDRVFLHGGDVKAFFTALFYPNMEACEHCMPVTRLVQGIGKLVKRGCKTIWVYLCTLLMFSYLFFPLIVIVVVIVQDVIKDKEEHRKEEVHRPIIDRVHNGRSFREFLEDTVSEARSKVRSKNYDTRAAGVVGQEWKLRKNEKVYTADDRRRYVAMRAIMDIYHAWKSRMSIEEYFNAYTPATMSYYSRSLCYCRLFLASKGQSPGEFVTDMFEGGYGEDFYEEHTTSPLKPL